MIDMEVETGEVAYTIDRDNKVRPLCREAELLMSGAISAPWDPLGGDRRHPWTDARPGDNTASYDEKYGPSAYFVGCSLGHDPDDWAKSDRDIAFHVSVGDGVCDAMIMKRAMERAGGGKVAPDGSRTVSYKDLKDYVWERQPLLFDYRIPEGDEFDQACSKYAKRHPFLWFHRNDPDFGDSSEDRMAARRALWMLHEYDPEAHPERGTNARLERFWNLIDGKGCFGGGECFGDGLIERVARLREGVDPRWVMGDVCGLKEVGREAQALREVDADALATLPERLRRGAFVAPDEAEARCRLACYRERAKRIDANVLDRQRVRNHQANITDDDVALGREIGYAQTREDIARNLQRSYDRFEADHQRYRADARDYGIRSIRMCQRVQPEYRTFARTVLPSLEAQYDRDPMKRRLCHELWTEQFQRRADSFTETEHAISDDLAMRGFARDVWEACGKGALPEADERQMEREDAAAAGRAARAREEDRQARIRRSDLQRDMDAYERDRARRIALHRPAPGDELTAEEHVVSARRREMADTGLSYDELYDDDPNHDFDPANW